MFKLNSWLVTPIFLILLVEGCGFELLRFCSLFSFSWGLGLLQYSVVCLASWPIGHYILFGKLVITSSTDFTNFAQVLWIKGHFTCYIFSSLNILVVVSILTHECMYIHVYLKQGTIKYNICVGTQNHFFFDTYTISVLNNIHI